MPHWHYTLTEQIRHTEETMLSEVAYLLARRSDFDHGTAQDEVHGILRVPLDIDG